jgi:hypothetical protein
MMISVAFLGTIWYDVRRATVDSMVFVHIYLLIRYVPYKVTFRPLIIFLF